MAKGFTGSRYSTFVMATALIVAGWAAGDDALAQVISVTSGTSGTIGENEEWSLDDPAGTLDGATLVDSGGVLTINRTADGTISQDISGGGDVYKNQESDWTLSGDNTGFAGNFYLAAGGLEFADDAARGNGTIVFSGGKLVYATDSVSDWSADFGGNQFRIETVGGGVDISYGNQIGFGFGASLQKLGAGSLTLAPPENEGNSFPGGVVISAGRLVLENEGIKLGDAVTNSGVLEVSAADGFDFTNSSPVSGTGTIEKWGLGTVTLTGTNTHTGGTRAIEGALVGTTWSLAGAIHNDSALIVDQSTSGTIPGIVSGTGSLEIKGSGAITLTGNNTFTGPVTLTDGSLVLGSASALGSGGEILFNNGRLQFTAAGTTDPSARFSTQPSQTFNIGVDAGAQVTFASGLESASGSLEKYGAGTLVLGTSCNYDGGTIVYGGTLAGTVTSIVDVVSLEPGTTLRIDEEDVGEFVGIVSGFGAFEKTGFGELALGASVVLDLPETRVVAGVLEGPATALSGSFAVNTGATLRVTDVGTFSGSVTGSGNLEIDSGGTVALTGTSALGGDIIVKGGTLVLAANNLSGSVGTELTCTVRFDQGTSGTFTGSIDTSAGYFVKAGAGALSISGALNAADVSIEAGTLRLSSGSITETIVNSGTLEKIGAGTLSVQDVVSPIGGTIVVSEGTLEASSFVIPGNITTNGTLVFDESYGSNTFSGTISGTGTFAKSGPDDLALTALSTFTGPTNVLTGRLGVDGALSNTAVTVFNGAELGGSGSIAGSVSVLTGGVLAPGNSIQSLATGTVTCALGATFAYEVDSTNVGALGTAADLLVVTGNLNLDAANGSQLTLADLNATPNEFIEDTTVFAMINYTGTWNGGLFTYATEVLSDGEQFSVGDQQWRIDYNYVYDAGNPTTIRPLNFQSDYQPTSGPQTFVAITAVPEPSTSCLALAGLAAVAWTAARRGTRNGRPHDAAEAPAPASRGV